MFLASSSKYDRAITSVPVQQAISEFSEYAVGYDIDGLHDQAERIGIILDIFAKKQLGAKAMDMAGLQVPASYVFGAGGERLAHAGAWAMTGHYTRPDYPMSVDDIFYAASLKGDLRKIDYAGGDWERRLQETPDGAAIFDMLTRADKRPLTPSDYENVKLGINVPNLAETSRLVNVESLLARAALVFDGIVHPPEGDPRRQMMAILRAETFDAPMLDALGMSAYEMAMRSEIGQVRTIGAGRPDLVDLARTKLEAVGDTAQSVLSEELFGHASEQRTFHIDDNTPYGETIRFSEHDLAELTNGKFQGRELGRRKTIGSLAQKMLHKKAYESKLPQDIIGRVAILEDREQLADFVAFILHKVEQSDRLSFAVAASKSKPIYAQGREDYLHDLEENIGSTIFGSIETEQINKPQNETFQVVKITFNVLVDGVEVPVEYQFQTAEDREIARVGGAAHPFIKVGSTGNLILPPTIVGDKHDLRVIRARKEALLGGDAKSDNITVGSASGHEFINAILRSL